MSYRDPDEWLTPAQAAPELGLHPKTVRQLCADKAIRRRKTTGPGGQPRYRIQRSAITAYNRRGEEAA